MKLPLTFIGAFGMKDPRRDNIKSCMKYAKEQGGINIRMVSGDHIDTAKVMALKTGILSPEQADHPNAVMTGEQFRNKVGGLIQY